jgi:nucleoside-diphosphate-sugar epimerase
MRLFVFGLGYSARVAVERLRPRLDAVWGTTRSAARLGGIAASGAEPLLFGENLTGPLGQSDHVLVSIAPDEAGDPILSRYARDLAAMRPRSLVYLSTVGVYGDHGGAWVDEGSECRPVSQRSQQRLKAEAAWRRFSQESGVPVAILRLAGIYGPGRGPFEKIRRGTARRIVKLGQVFNRIHVDDIAAIIEAAFERRADGVFNGADDEPAPPQDVLAYAADLLGLPPPPEIAFKAADLSPMALSFYGENKRVRNDRIKRELGVRLAFPTYREGLRAVLEAERDRAFA